MLGVVALVFTTGCPVPQQRGDGRYTRVVEPKTKAAYHLYLPVDYVKNSRVHPTTKKSKWPLVMTFHGMKPYDNAKPQEREWEKEADFYGYIVCAPELATSDSFMQYPLKEEHSYVLRDKRNVLAIMDHVFATTRADPDAVLSTSWSCGGYLAHYFVNLYPERFSCLATRLSNFSADLLREENVSRYRDLPVAVFIGDGDFPKCKSDSQEAVAWYTARRFAVVRGKMIDHMAHRRIPQTAAAFFAEQMGLRPIRPAQAAVSLARVKMTEYRPPREMIAGMAPKTRVASARSSRRLQRAPRVIPRAKPTVPPVARSKPARYVAVNPGRNYPFGIKPAFDPNPVVERVSASPGRRSAAPSAAKTTRVARGERSSNWLEPTGAGNRRAGRRGEPGRTPRRQPLRERSTRSASRDAAKAGGRRVASADGNRSPAATGGSTRPRNSDPAGTKGRRVASGTNGRNGARRQPTFQPRDAGPRTKPGRSAATMSRVGTPSPGRVARADLRSTHAPSALQAAMQRRVTAKNVDIKLKGPSIGRTPYFLDYSVELPESVERGADFLWMDNGVWMGDEPRGVELLDTPGIHRISVLVITRDNREFRGTATVHVLKRRPGRASRVSR